MTWVKADGWYLRSSDGYYGIRFTDGIFHAYSMPMLWSIPELIGTSDMLDQSQRICESHREGV